jgi:Lrp/AsnC family transcriptional regulator
MAEPLSPIDLKILDQIQKDASLSTTELAEKVGLSQSPCWRRLQRLREEGYIKGQVALLDRKQLGDAIIVFATLKMAALSTSSAKISCARSKSRLKSWSATPFSASATS